MRGRGGEVRGRFQGKPIVSVQNYLDDTLVPRTENPLEWWKKNFNNFPNLSILVPKKNVLLPNNFSSM